MIGSFLTRGLVLVFGYAYPAYECYKTVEKNKPEIEQLRFWCQYWILVAMLTVFERVGDIFISWLPMYSEAKLAFFIYLWCPKTKGTNYIYSSFFRPYLAKHELEIDRSLLEMRAKAGDFAVIYCRQAISYGQTRIFEILRYVAAQSTSTPRPSQQQESARVAEPPPVAPTHPSTNASQPTPQLPPKGSSTATITTTTTQPSTSKANATTLEDQQHKEHELDSAAAAAAAPAPPAAKRVTKAVTKQLTKETTSKSMQNLGEAMQTNSSASLTSENANPSTTDSGMEDAIRITRRQLRKTRASTIH